MNRFNFMFFAALLFAVPAVQAQDAEHHHHAAAEGAMSTGEVVKIDMETGKITLRHGPLANLNMGGMTMAFKVAQPAMLEQVKPGDKVQFVADKVGGALTIVTLQGVN